MKLRAFLTLCLILAICSFPICAHPATLILYDNFNSSVINPDKWDGYESNNNCGVTREAVREIESNALRMSVHGYGIICTEGSCQASGGDRLRIKNGSGIIAIKANITVTTALCTKPDTTSTPSKIRAGIGGRWFNSSKSTSGDATGDIGVDIRLERQSGMGSKDLNVIGVIYKCMDSGCNNSSSPVNPSTVIVGTAKVGKKVSLSVTWNKAKKRFIFQQDKNSPVYLSYTGISDSHLPGTDNKRLTVDVNVPNCLSEPCYDAQVNALFDNVYIGR